MSLRSSTDLPDSNLPDCGVLLDALQKETLERVVPALERALGRVDDYLFDRSQSGHDDLGMTALRALRRVRGQICPRFEQAITGGFRALRDPGGSGSSSGHSALTLLSEEGLEEHLATEQLAESLSRMHAPSLELLGKRLAHIVSIDQLQANDNPLTPAFMASALRKAVESAELDPGLRIVVCKFFERELAIALAHTYDRSNTLLIAAGVLPQLRSTVKAEAMPATGPGQGGGHTNTGEAGHSGLGSIDGETADGGAAGASWGDAAAINPAEQAVFSNLLGLLQGWRSTMGPRLGGQGGTGPIQTLGSNELLAILSLLQRDEPPQLQQSSAGADRSLATHLRQEVVQGARKLGVSADNLHLDGLDGDAVDLVALLFDVLLDGPQFDVDIRRKIGRMLVPYVKVAVQDRRMFLFKEHPARRLLNTVAEACQGNHGEAAPERELLGRVDQTINRLVGEFNEDVAIFETLEQELRGFMAQHRKRFELAEKRSADAQRGRERLEMTRNAVSAELAQHTGERNLPPVLDQFLSRHTSHHLTQVVLRDGHRCPRHEEAMRAVDELLAAFDYAELRTPVEDLPALPHLQIEAILASAGCTSSAAEEAIKTLREALERLSRGDDAGAVSLRMPEQVLAPEPVMVGEAEPLLSIVSGTDNLDFDATMLEQMRRLQVGSWIQLATSEERVEPTKVSWISPISARFLLVNRRGIRVLVASAEELAAMAKLGKVSVREGDNAFEDAMHQVADRLKSAAQRV